MSATKRPRYDSEALVGDLRKERRNAIVLAVCGVLLSAFLLFYFLRLSPEPAPVTPSEHKLEAENRAEPLEAPNKIQETAPKAKKIVALEPEPPAEPPPEVPAAAETETTATAEPANPAQNETEKKVEEPTAAATEEKAEAEKTAAAAEEKENVKAAVEAVKSPPNKVEKATPKSRGRGSHGKPSRGSRGGKRKR